MKSGVATWLISAYAALLLCTALVIVGRSPVGLPVALGAVGVGVVAALTRRSRRLAWLALAVVLAGAGAVLLDIAYLPSTGHGKLFAWSRAAGSVHLALALIAGLGAARQWRRQH